MGPDPLSPSLNLPMYCRVNLILNSVQQSLWRFLWVHKTNVELMDKKIFTILRTIFWFVVTCWAILTPQLYYTDVIAILYLRNSYTIITS